MIKISQNQQINGQTQTDNGTVQSGNKAYLLSQPIKDSVNFSGENSEDKKSNVGKWIVGLAVAGGAIFLGMKFMKGGTKKIGESLSKIENSAKNTVDNAPKSPVQPNQNGTIKAPKAKNTAVKQESATRGEDKVALSKEEPQIVTPEVKTEEIIKQEKFIGGAKRLVLKAETQVKYAEDYYQASPHLIEEAKTNLVEKKILLEQLENGKSVSEAKKMAKEASGSLRVKPKAENDLERLTREVAVADDDVIHAEQYYQANPDEIDKAHEIAKQKHIILDLVKNGKTIEEAEKVVKSGVAPMKTPTTLEEKFAIKAQLTQELENAYKHYTPSEISKIETKFRDNQLEIDSMLSKGNTVKTGAVEAKPQPQPQPSLLSSLISKEGALEKQLTHANNVYTKAEIKKTKAELSAQRVQIFKFRIQTKIDSAKASLSKVFTPIRKLFEPRTENLDSKKWVM